jgi:poly-beta-1,6-N-acetyl-D-glucosamine N-deacetylase
MKYLIKYWLLCIPQVLIIIIVVICIYIKSTNKTTSQIISPIQLVKHNNLTSISEYKTDVKSPVQIEERTVDKIKLVFITGGKTVTIHVPKPTQIVKIVRQNNVIAGIDGTFFVMSDSESNRIIGPMLSSRNNSKFIPGELQDTIKSTGRPLALISIDKIKFLPFNPKLHNTLKGIASELPNVTDAFVCGGWLVRKGKPQTLASFGNLYKVNEPRYRAFWGINSQGKPTLGISKDNIGAVDLGNLLAKEGWKEAVMLDSGQSTSLAYKGKSLVDYTPRPVPHMVGLVEQ